MNGEDVGMLDAGQRLGLALEAREAFRVSRHRLREDLDGDVAVEPFIAGAVHLAHATRADEIRQPVVPEESAPHVQPPDHGTRLLDDTPVTGGTTPDGQSCGFYSESRRQPVFHRQFHRQCCQ
jgi:hypothetical protein